MANKLQTEKVLQSGLVVSSTLVDRLEVYGYINSCRGYDVKVNKFGSGYNVFGYNDFVNNVTIGEVVCAGFLMQPVLLVDEYGRSVNGMKIHQVYSVLEVAKEPLKLDLANLDVPSLGYHPVYKKIRKKDSRVAFSDSDVKMEKEFPEKIKKRSDFGHNFDYYTEVGDILCRDKAGIVKGIGEHLMALCRYLAPQTGLMCYAQFDLDELYVEESK